MIAAFEMTVARRSSLQPCEVFTSFRALLRAAPLSIEASAMRTPSVKSRALPATRRAAAAVITAASRKAPSCPSSTPRRASALCAASPPLRSAALPRARPTSSGVSSIARDLAVLQFGDPGRAGSARSHRSRLRHGRSRRVPQPRLLSTCAKGSTQCLGEDAGDLAPDAGRIGQGAEKIEDRARAEFDAASGRHASSRHDGRART